MANPNKEDSATEDRIASILNEAQQAMQAKKSAEQVRSSQSLKVPQSSSDAICG